MDNSRESHDFRRFLLMNKEINQPDDDRDGEIEEIERRL